MLINNLKDALRRLKRYLSLFINVDLYGFLGTLIDLRWF
jgi:hypothetical protein